ncbi:hypothetical protein [Plantactinospora sp. CA-290183]|uniref:hypothetical protein n=1 Tax=Plantactinospora sp. CA-290183 TaxID=3240006 RepID=UPI003D8B1C78
MTRQEPARSEPTTAAPEAEEERQEEPGGRGDWADEAAKARSLDDPRRLPPHDSAGLPSSGPNR